MLENIGFYTLSDKRAQEVSIKSRLQRCELLLTSRCNFKCPYCRGMKEEDQGDLSFEEAERIVRMWASEGLKNIRFSGGEPTLWKDLYKLVRIARGSGIERCAISTNGSMPLRLYEMLHNVGVNDFSISLDSCCAATGNKMAGGLPVFDIIIGNIKALSKLTYVTVGVVLTEENQAELNDIIKFASDLGVADIRIIPAAQVRKEHKGLKQNGNILDKHPILSYRVNNFLQGKSVRGLVDEDNHQCPLVLDDMAILNGKHYPCIIYMREQGDHIGSAANDIVTIRHEREQWFLNHDCYKDPICRNNCLDVCVDYNNRVRTLNKIIY